MLRTPISSIIAEHYNLSHYASSPSPSLRNAAGFRTTDTDILHHCGTLQPFALRTLATSRPTHPRRPLRFETPQGFALRTPIFSIIAGFRHLSHYGINPEVHANECHEWHLGRGGVLGSGGVCMAFTPFVRAHLGIYPEGSKCGNFTSQNTASPPSHLSPPPMPRIPRPD